MFNAPGVLAAAFELNIDTVPFCSTVNAGSPPPVEFTAIGRSMSTYPVDPARPMLMLAVGLMVEMVLPYMANWPNTSPLPPDITRLPSTALIC